MKKNKVVHAWRNADAFHKLSVEERAQLPESPAALVEVDDDVLSSITGGCGTVAFCPTSALCTPCPPMHCAA